MSVRWRDISGYIEEFHRLLACDLEHERLIDIARGRVRKVFLRRHQGGLVEAD